ncbi:glycosyltransferase family 4 protein [Staphylococcus lutrae]|uniref:Glycosyltransferase WbuB n=1 Tax=Staphylococcus lutrae TaxID=155085 RepID=A0AAC9RV51_9STAP|nr:glycosyltransferase family 4 protein [Staphylococcus lutrae]ARJ51490.1 glycosyltransferase WbuB [Staphylococcus lutrae]PNZ38679.1 glycosyltransferase WbuB [Staphylococcus lutrae]
MKRKILIISQNFYPELGSAANRMKKIFEQLNQRGFSPIVLTTEPSYPNKTLFKNRAYFDSESLNALEGTQIHRIRMKFDKQHPNLCYRLLYYLELMIKVKAYLKQKIAFDNIYVTSPNIFLAWATLFFKTDRKAKYFLEIRDLWPDSFLGVGALQLKWTFPLLKFLEKKMYQSADEIVVNNPYFEQHIKAMIGETSSFIYLPNAFTKDEVQVQQKRPYFSVIYSGNLGYAQNVEQLIDIARQLNQAHIHFTVMIYGVHAHQFRQVVKNEGLSYVHLIPPMKRTPCLKMISEHHVSLSILKPTGVFMNVMPGKVMDSICCGTPVVCNLGAPVDQLIQQYGVGYAKAHASTEDIIAYIKQLKNDHETLTQTISHTVKLRDEALMWERNIEKLIARLRGN